MDGESIMGLTSRARRTVITVVAAMREEDYKRSLEMMPFFLS